MCPTRRAPPGFGSRSTIHSGSAVPTRRWPSGPPARADRFIIGSRIVATGRAVPRTALTNKDLERYMDTSDQWIRSRTGIGSRYAMRQGESLADIATDASRTALDRAGVKPGELDAIIVGTVSSEYAFPSLACQIQKGLGISSMPAFDVAAACSGFGYALQVATAQKRAGVKLEEIDLFVPHQANMRIISAVAERLGMPPEKVFTNIDRYGNTSEET